MNFSGPFDAGSAHDSPVSLGGERFSFDSKPNFVQHHASDNHVVVPDAHLLFSGDYTRIGSDLIISANGQKFVVGNYFKGETRPALTTKDGATLAGHVVDALTGHVHYAQATAPAPAGEVIGHVLKMSGSAAVVRNGVSVELHIGDAVQKGDVIQTGSNSSIGMTFVDGSAFGMTSNARMVLNEMIFDPNGSSNSSLISLVQGTITFVAGQTAKNGNMRVETPVATMGIRGTAVLVEIGANDGPTKFSVLVEPDGHTGSYNLYDKTTGQLIGTVSQAGQVTYVSVSGIGQAPTAIEQLKTLADQEAAKTLIQEVFKLYFPNYNPDNSNPKSQKNGFGSPGDNLNPFAFYKPPQDIGPPKIIIVPGVGIDPVTGQPNPPRVFYNTKAQFSALPVFADQAFAPTSETFKFMDVVKIDDPDIGNAPFYDIGVPFVAGSAVIKSAVSTIGYLSEAFLKPLLNINQTTGVVTFDREQFNFLDDGQTITFKIQVTATSGPDSGLVEIPVTITGANDAPTIVVGAATIIAGTVKEDVPAASGHIESNGTITFQDVDLTDAHTATVELTSTASTLPGFVSGAGSAPTTTKIGTFTIDPVSESTTDTNNHGSVGWHFSLDDNDPTLQSLAEGQTIKQIYTITITDDNGVPVTQTVTITITGTNDAPVLTADTSVHQADEVPNTTGAPNSVVDVATGTLAFTDVDLSDTHTASAALHPGASSVVWSGGNYNDIPQATRDALNDAVTASVSESNTDTNNQGSVGWEFKLPDHLFDFLAKGQTLTLIYDVTVTDNNGLSSTKQVTVQIGAANDQPVISVIDSDAAVKEDVGAVGGILKDAGVVTFTDTDLTDTHTAHVAYNNDAAGSAGVSPALALALATALTVPASALAAGDHDFNWDFALDTSLIQYLAEGETITATYTITVEDNSNSGNGTSVAKTVTVTITGTNDAPTITSSTAAASATVPELPATTGSGSLDQAGGTVTFGDLDLTDTHQVTQSTATFDWSGGILTASQITALTNASARTLVPHDSTGTGSGSVDWTYKITDSALDFLAVGQTLKVTYDITVADYHNGISTGTSTVQTVTVTYTGANDAPIVSAAVSDALVIEDGLNSVLNALANALDVDDGATLSVVNVPGTLPAGVTYNAANHTFTLDPSNAAYQHLAEGATTTVTVDYGVSDGIVTTPTPASVSWTITGTNDAPVVSGAVSDALVVEDGPGSVLNALANASDVDDGTTLSVVNVPGVDAPGTLPPGVSYDSGTHTFTLDPSDAAYQSLAAGASTTVTVTYDISDGLVTTPASVSWTITGTNDAPTITGPATADVTEDSLTPQVSGQLLSHDPDAGATAIWQVENGNVAGASSYTFAIDEFMVSRSNGSGILQTLVDDTFTGGSVPPTSSATFQFGNSAGAFATYGVLGGFSAGVGTAIMTEADAAPLTILNNTVQYIGDIAILQTNATPGSTAGLRQATEFAVEGRFALNLPTNIGEAYGIRIGDQGGNGDDIVQLDVVRGFDGHVYLELRQLDVPAGTSTLLEHILLNPAAGDDQIDLQLHHAANSTAVTASAYLYNSSTQIAGPAINFTESGSVFVTATDWARGGVFSYTPQITYSSYHGTYGNLVVDQTGKWTYALDGHSQAVQALGANDTVIDNFTIQVKDDQGVIAEQAVAVTVHGTNDAPVLNGDNVSVSEIGDGSPTLPYGTTKVFDVTLSDADETGSLKVSATAGYGTVSAPASGTVAEINNAFANGITYTPTSTPLDGNDKVTLTITDSHHLSDTLNFIFNQTGQNGATLVSTAEKDILFATGSPDTFVFSTDFNHDAIRGFDLDNDIIKINDVVQSVQELYEHATKANGGADALITPDTGHPGNTILLKGVTVQQLHDHSILV